MISVPLPLFRGKEVLKKRNTKKLGPTFQHSSGRTPNFSIHRLSCFKCTKARRAVQPTEWNAVVLFALLEFVSVSGGGGGGV